jgi:translation initiation factor IF-2
MIFEGKLLSLKRFKDDVKEVAKGYDCGIQINEFNDLLEGDIIQFYQEIAVKRKL